MPKRHDDLNFDESTDSNWVRQTIKRKMMDLIARREHSETELRQKLSAKFSAEGSFDDLIEEVLETAKAQKWIGESSEQAQRVVDQLHSRGKGIEYINAYLQEKGLPTVAADNDLELKKALDLVKNKYSAEHEFSLEQKAKMARFLASRGFDSDTVRKVIYEKL